MSVLVGTAGFSYADWKGNFYPAGISQRDMLEKYADHFPVVEINSTYYGIPEPGRIESMAHRTPEDFVFNVKANREMTHEITAGREVFEKFRRAIRPLIERGKLGCVLAQFPWGFQRTTTTERYLAELAARMEGLDTVVEFRNSGWDGDEALDLLASLGLGYCCVDEPDLEGLPSRSVAVTGRTAYLRMHGRNAANWWAKGRRSWERYDYLYSDDELREWLSGVEKMSENSDVVYVIFNNHYKGQAPANAHTFENMLRALLGSELIDNRGQTSLFD